MAQADSFIEDARGVSEALAVALLIGIVVLGVAVLLGVGATQLGEDQTAVEVGQAEQALVQFDAEAARVATGGTTTQDVDLGVGVNRGTLDVENDSGHVTVEYVDVDLENTSRTTIEVVNASLGTVVYKNGGRTVGYQGGGVWGSGERGSMMVSPPEITFQGKTLTMTLVETEGSSVYSDVQLTRTRSDTEFPNATANLTNKVDRGKIVVTIQSRYYRAWGGFFEQETGAIVQYNHTAERVTVVFLALPKDFAPDAGIIATSGPGELRLDGTGAYVDSYNSSKGPYEQSDTTEGIVKAAGDIVMDGDSEIDGDTHSGKDTNLTGGAVINGSAKAKETINVDGSSNITGATDENASSVVLIPPVNQLVERKETALEDRNNNTDTVVIQNNELAVDQTNDTLGPGTYYLENFHLEGETLVLNATGGNITIVVRDWVLLEKVGGSNSHVRVEGNGTVQLFVASESKVDVSVPGAGQAPLDLDEVHFFVERNGTIEVPGDKSPQFRVFAPDRFVGAIGGSSSESANVTATIIAPAGRAGDGQFYIQHGELYGAVVTGNLTLGQYGQAHFDRALLDERLVLAPDVPRIDYLYVTEYELKVGSS